MLIQQLAWVSSLSSHTQGAAPLSTSSGGPDCQRSKALENDVAGKQCEKIGGKKKKIKKVFFRVCLGKGLPAGRVLRLAVVEQ